MRLSFRLCFLILCSSLLVIPGHAHPVLPKKHVALFLFGDSFFDAGNNNYINTTIQANFWPYGETFFNYPTGRFSDGRIIPDFIAEYANLPFISTYLPSYNDQFIYGVNFASAGAGALVETLKGSVIDLKTQLSYFNIVEIQLKQKLGDARAKTLLSKAVYLFSIGTNDYLVPFSTNSSVLQSDFSKKEYVGLVIGNLTSVIKEIYEKGGRKFGFLNMGPLGCLPGVKVAVPGVTGSCLEGALDFAKLHNQELPEVLQELQNQLKGFRYSVHDFYNSLSKRINNPSRYGFKDSTMACCGSGPFRGIRNCGAKNRTAYELCDNPKEYLFFDSFHPSEKANKQIAELMWSNEPNVTGPCNVKTLFEQV